MREEIRELTLDEFWVTWNKETGSKCLSAEATRLMNDVKKALNTSISGLAKMGGFPVGGFQGDFSRTEADFRLTGRKPRAMRNEAKVKARLDFLNETANLVNMRLDLDGPPPIKPSAKEIADALDVFMRAGYTISAPF